jgi:hypothetical protein
MLLFLSLSQSLHKAAFPWQPESSSSHAWTVSTFPFVCQSASHVVHCYLK